jgi:uncharacterized protein with HEPN domain
VRNLEIIGEAASHTPVKYRRDMLTFHGWKCARCAISSFTNTME